jgi:predicted dehydrogenase
VETFRELYRSVYTAIGSGTVPTAPDFPTFADGHRANVLGDAIALSNAERRWVEVED